MGKDGNVGINITNCKKNVLTFSGQYDILDLNRKQQILASILLKKHILQKKREFILIYDVWRNYMEWVRKSGK